MTESPNGRVRRDVLEWFVAHVESLLSPRDASAFERLCADVLPSLIGHRAMIAAVGRVSLTKSRVLHAWNFGCPVELFAEMTRDVQVANQSTLARWLKSEQPLFIDPEPDPAGISLALARHGLDCRALHGVVDGGGAVGSCFAFFGLQPEHRVRVTEALRLVVPHLHACVMRLCREQSASLSPALTLRERQLIQLVSEGKSNDEIAGEWSRSSATVRNLLHTLMGKLRVRSRAQLVGLAIEMSLLDSGISQFPFT